MSEIKGPQKLAEILRFQLESTQQGARSAKPKKALTAPKAEDFDSTLDQNDIGRRTVERAKAIDKNDPQRTKKIFRIFLELTLLNEFGSEIANDPQFSEMLDYVETNMHKNPDTALSIEAAIKHLIGQ